MGCPPFLRHSYRREKLSVIASLTVSPLRQRVGLYVRFHSTNLTRTEVIGFLQHLLRYLRGPVVLVWEGGRSTSGKMSKPFFVSRRGCISIRSQATPLNSTRWSRSGRLANATSPTVSTKRLINWGFIWAALSEESRIPSDCSAPASTTLSFRGHGTKRKRYPLLVKAQ